ncbi:MAG TPA: hypothetical protein RMH99_29290 [Sandaracinaceae bacterium LLY-WYZ-13_1]|nr:hypothetical protein [Sandaracinaceae bacterium LLY-WYZ-13_1]
MSQPSDEPPEADPDDESEPDDERAAEDAADAAREVGDADDGDADGTTGGDEDAVDPDEDDGDADGTAGDDEDAANADVDDADGTAGGTDEDAANADAGHDGRPSAARGRPATPWWRRWLVPAIVFAVTALIYALVAGPRTEGPSPNNHFSILAQSWLDGHLGLEGRPPHLNDWACYDEEMHAVCPPRAQLREGEHWRWYVSFPPFPSVLVLPMVALFGLDFSGPLFWAILAGLAPAFLFVLLRRLREERISPRSFKEDLVLVAVFALGTVYFPTAVHGSVWFAAQVVASILLVLFFHGAIGIKHPLLAGVALALCFWTRPSTSLWALFFLLEAMRVSRRADAPDAPPDASVWRKLGVWLGGVRWRGVIRPCLVFSAPILAVGAVAMWMNEARFEDPFEFGHAYLMIRWRPRIEKWGLFNYHYLSKNLAVFLASLPWLSATAPYLKISRHGLAIWVTSPNLIPALWPKRVTPLMGSLFTVTGLVALLDLCYQNSGWVQFGYRFALDYMPALIVLLALSRRRFGVGFGLLLAAAIVVNTFGAITFDRAAVFYDDDATQERVFQPD